MKFVILPLLAILLASLVPISIAQDSNPQIQTCHMTFHITTMDYEIQWGVSYDVLVFNPSDTVVDQNVPDAQDSEGNLLVDLITTDNNGKQCSVAGGQYSVSLSDDGTHDLIVFHFTDLYLLPEEYPKEATTRLVLLSSGEVLDSAITFSPYKDSSEYPYILPLKCPKLVYPYRVTILDTTPTIIWEPLAAPHPDASTGFNLHLEFEDNGYHYWGIYPPREATQVTFPNAPEYPDLPQIRIPPDPDFPSNLPIGICLVNLIYSESFENIGGDPRCSVAIPRHTLTMFEINAQIDIAPSTLNLASNGKWIQALIELPEGYHAQDVDVSSIRINNEIPVDISAPIQISDSNGDGNEDLTVRFDRTAVNTLLGNIPDLGVDTGKSFDATLTITGNVEDYWFSNICTVRVLRK